MPRYNFYILNLEGHPNCIAGSRVTAILLKGWILPIGGALAFEGLRLMGLRRLVFIYCSSILKFGLYIYFFQGHCCLTLL